MCTYHPAAFRKIENATICNHYTSCLEIPISPGKKHDYHESKIKQRLNLGWRPPYRTLFRWGWCRQVSLKPLTSKRRSEALGVQRSRSKDRRPNWPSGRPGLSTVMRLVMIGFCWPLFGNTWGQWTLCLHPPTKVQPEPRSSSSSSDDWPTSDTVLAAGLHPVFPITQQQERFIADWTISNLQGLLT